MWLRLYRAGEFATIIMYMEVRGLICTLSEMFVLKMCVVTLMILDCLVGFSVDSQCAMAELDFSCLRFSFSNLRFISYGVLLFIFFHSPKNPTPNYS